AAPAVLLGPVDADVAGPVELGLPLLEPLHRAPVPARRREPAPPELGGHAGGEPPANLSPECLLLRRGIKVHRALLGSRARPLSRPGRGGGVRVGDTLPPAQINP